MESWTNYGTVHTPVEVFTGSRENKNNQYVLANMQVKGSLRLYLGLFLKEGRKKKFIANFRVGLHGLPREEAIARLKAKAD